MSALRLARALHAPRPRDQVRRLLPRPRRPVPRERRLRARDARHSRLARRAVGGDGRHDRRASTTTSTASPRRSSATARVSRRSSSSRSPGTWAASRPRPASSRRCALLCDAAGALLVFDEVITGFRVARGGAQELFGVHADLTVLGKIVGGGLPLAAFGGRADVLERLAPSGDVYQAGTLSGNPLATAAGRLGAAALRDPAVYDELERRSARLGAGLAPFGRVQRVGAMLTLFAGRDEPVERFTRARHRDVRRALPRPARARHLRRAEPVRVPLPVARARRRRDRRDDRGGGAMSVGSLTRSPPGPARRATSGRARCATTPDWEPVFSPLAPSALALGLETVYEAYLVHYGRPRLFAAPDARRGDPARRLPLRARPRADRRGGRCAAVAVLAELISRCAALRADGAGGDGDGWVDAARALGGTPTDDEVALALALPLR